MNMKTHWKKAFKSDYLSSSDIDGKDLILTIKNVRLEECKTQSGKKMCNVAHFVETNIKPMILNVGNSKIVKKFANNQTHLEDWNNIKIQIYVDPKVKFGNDTVEGLRIRTTQPAKQKKLTPLTEDKIQSAINFIVGGKTIEDLKQHYSFDKDIENKILEGVNNV